MKELNDEQKAQIAKLAALDDASIDTSDIPQFDNWNGAVVGKFHNPVKKRRQCTWTPMLLTG